MTESPGHVRAEKAPPGRWRATFVHLSLVLFAAVVVGRAAQIQLFEHTYWAQKAASQHLVDVAVTPPRGAILDATGNVLVETREQVRLIVEPHNLRRYPRVVNGRKSRKDSLDARVELRKTLKSLRVPDAWVVRALNRKYRWVEMPQRFAPADVQRLKGVPGVRLVSGLERVNSTPEGLRGIVGVFREENDFRSGLERQLDEYLRGEIGHDSLVKDGSGRRVVSPQLRAVAARPGHQVTLTINQQLQEIAEEALADARARTNASGGDVLILDPRDGAVLALAGIRDGKAAYTSNALTESYEPGSVMKPFVVARLLDLQRVSPDQVFNTYDGRWKHLNKTYTDIHEAPTMSVRDIVRYSSNIGTAQLALRLSAAEQYEALRDFGFGVPTGIEYPSESRGTLPLPPWKGILQTQLSIGYNMTASPLQLAVAYAALANGGELVQPSLVREVRDASGTVLYRHKRQVIRRAISRETAALMREMLKSVVDSGTATSADLATFDVGGKSGTARRTIGRNYVEGKYNSSFAAMFPVEAPQYVIVARVIDPKGTYYGGIVSGNVVKDILQSAIATSDASLDRAELARLARPMPAPPPKPRTPEQLRIALRDSLRFDSLKAPLPPKAEPLPMPSRVVVELPYAPRAKVAASVPSELRAVPSVFGLSARQATRTLHAAGFQVAVVEGKAVRTRPLAGVMLRAGSTVQLESPR